MVTATLNEEKICTFLVGIYCGSGRYSPVWKCIRLPLCASYPQGVDAIFVVLLCGFELLACLSREQVVQGGDVDVCPSGSGVIA